MLGNEEAMFISGRVSVVFHPEEGGPRFFTHDLRKNEPNREIPFEAFQLFPQPRYETTIDEPISGEHKKSEPPSV